MKEYLTVPDVLAIHSILIQRYGGTHGIRDRGALESALFRLQSGYYVDIVAEATALMESLAINHHLCRWQQTSSFCSYRYFSSYQCYRINCESVIIYADMMQMFEANTFDFAHLELWLRKLVTKSSKI